MRSCCARTRATRSSLERARRDWRSTHRVNRIRRYRVKRGFLLVASAARSLGGVGVSSYPCEAPRSTPSMHCDDSASRASRKRQSPRRVRARAGLRYWQACHHVIARTGPREGLASPARLKGRGAGRAQKRQPRQTCFRRGGAGHPEVVLRLNGGTCKQSSLT